MCNSKLLHSNKNNILVKKLNIYIAIVAYAKPSFRVCLFSLVEGEMIGSREKESGKERFP